METQDIAETNAGAEPSRPIGGGPLTMLAVLVCPRLCAGPLLVAGLASTGQVRALHNAPWPLIAGAALAVVALGVGGTRARPRGTAARRPLPAR